MDKDKSIIAAIALAFLLVITLAGGWSAIGEAVTMERRPLFSPP